MQQLAAAHRPHARAQARTPGTTATRRPRSSRRPPASRSRASRSRPAASRRGLSSLGPRACLFPLGQAWNPPPPPPRRGCSSSLLHLALGQGTPLTGTERYLFALACFSANKPLLCTQGGALAAAAAGGGGPGGAGGPAAGGGGRGRRRPRAPAPRGAQARPTRRRRAARRRAAARARTRSAGWRGWAGASPKPTFTHILLSATWPGAARSTGRLSP